MSHLPVSVIIVSRGRPAALIRCLAGLSQQFYPTFEVIVVADPPGVAAVELGPYATSVKLVKFDEPNISKARNLGIAHAAGDIVAFIDDDAVPEPTWLGHLSAPFLSDAEVGAAGGFVRGRNGISFQWKARCFAQTGKTTGLILQGTQPVVLHPTPERAIKTEGTNMALRRDVIASMGGFDPAFRYYLDETDVNMRLARNGVATAIVPLAEVHHGYHANSIRNSNRAPRDLFEIGASLALFLRKHCAEQEHAQVWKSFQADQRKRALEFMVAGDLEPRDVRRLMSRLREGYKDGQMRDLESLPPISRSAEGLLPFGAHPDPHPVQLSGRFWSRRRLREEARSLVEAGKVVSLFLFSPTSLYHRVTFTSAGFWEQTGGIFGRSDRDQPLFRLTSFARRLRAEKLRVADQRRLFDE
ncbi:glycosyltransferase family 2 protein [Shimia thalassica]|uniref:glycosyltransferase family 2 protein n=1 Tax=Shimia thalassica TaxID=1715693 RepID=UPI0026E48ED7|nr:glycosyltransferase family 2 protein [Shimia thalassica]MDO6481171.1 glycosyltransferase family 2 protein [Shimia thalassica]